MKFSEEPVATGAGVTAIAAALVVVGKLTGLYTLSSDDAAVLVGAVVVIVSIVTSLIARSKVTPLVNPKTTVAQPLALVPVSAPSPTPPAPAPAPQVGLEPQPPVA